MFPPARLPAPKGRACLTGQSAGCSLLARVQGSSAAREGCVQLAALPRELLLRILHLAARPVSAWVGQ